MNINPGSFRSIEQLQDQYLASNQPINQKPGLYEGKSFNEILDQLSGKQSSGKLTFSKHAIGRLSERGIELSEGQLERLSNGTRMAGEKGINESLVLVDQLAFIVNIKSGTVITAMDQRETMDNVFTNIDGAVII